MKLKLTPSDIQMKRSQINEYSKRRKELLANEDIRIERNDEDAPVLYEDSQAALLGSIIQNLKEELENSEEVILEDYPENIIGLYDYVTLCLEYDGFEPEEVTYLICDVKVEGEATITTGSPIGLAVYGKAVGTVTSCKTPNGKLKITILEKTKGRCR